MEARSEFAVIFVERETHVTCNLVQSGLRQRRFCMLPVATNPDICTGDPAATVW